MEGETLIGVVSTTHKQDEWKIDYVATDPDREGEGIGSWLMLEIEKTARCEGVLAFTLHTASIREDLIEFYERHGFREVRRALPVHGKDAHLEGSHAERNLTLICVELSSITQSQIFRVVGAIGDYLRRTAVVQYRDFQQPALYRMLNIEIGH